MRKHKQKGLSPIAVILLIALTIIGGYLFYSSKINIPQKENDQSSATVVNETANWKTYTNSKYGYSIQYPSDWIVEDLGSYTYISKQGYEQSASNVFISPGEAGRGFWNNVKINESEILVDNIPGKRVDYLTDDGTAFFSAIRLNGYSNNGWDPNYNHIYLDLSKNMKFNDNSVQGDISELKILEQILFTFKFTD